MPAHTEPDIYDYLAKFDMSNLTITQLHNATKSTAIDKFNLEFWRGVITLAKIAEASRTYGHGLPVPEASAIVSQVVPTNDSVYWQPTGTEIWALQGLQITAAGGTPVCTVELFDGSDTVILHRGTMSTTPGSLFPAIPGAPLLIDNQVYIQVSNTDSTNAVNAALAYNKVSL